MQALLLAAMVAALASFAVWLMKVAGLTDAPLEAHKLGSLAKPTAGGLVLMPVFALAVFAVFNVEGFPVPSEDVRSALLVCLIGACVMAALGLVDDIRALSAALRLLCQIGVGVFIASLVRIEALPIPGFGDLPIGPVFGALGGAAWVVLCINAVNFIDGANGVASGAVFAGSLGLAALAFASGQPGVGLICLAFCASLLGFMVWNWARGLIFLGNVGALWAGTVFAALSLVLVTAPAAPSSLIADVGPYAVALCMFPVLADVLLTLFWRAKHGRTLTEGHREHVYQLALAAGLSHAQVAGILVFLTLKSVLIGFAASLFGPGAPILAFPVLIFAYARLDARVRRAALESGHLRG
jgi:UDP-N-acetylmuramyl pentapeptide phosphotransferase/UDP-N-acetylglucosamine-1-phosphate transferase